MARFGFASLAVLLLSMAPLAGACGSSSDPPGGRAGDSGAPGKDSGGPAGPSLDELPDVYSAAACEAFTGCLGSAAPLLLGGEDCRSSTRRTVEDLVDGIRSAIDDGRVRYDGVKVQQCMDALREAGCDYDTVSEEQTCLDALDGTVELGGDCSFSAECAGTAYCKSTGTCPGTCTRAEPEGGPCTSDSDCDSGLDCDETRGECFSAAGAGDRCGGGIEPECGPGLLCLGADDAAGRPGSCRSIAEVLSAAEGAACDPVAGPLCGTGLACVITAVAPAIEGACRKPVAAGAACGVAAPDQCPTAEYCMVPQGQLTGTCTPRPRAGEPCAAGPFGDPPDVCAPETRCDQGTCRSRQSLGGSCSTDAACLSEHCVGGRCALDGACE